MGSYITEKRRCNEGIKRRIFEEEKTFQKMRNILRNRHPSMRTTRRAVETYAWSVLAYGSETWTVNKKTEKSLENVDMWCWRGLLKVSWTERISNEEVVWRMDCGRELLIHVRGRQMRFVGHLRREGKENLSLTGRIPGSRA